VGCGKQPGWKSQAPNNRWHHDAHTIGEATHEYPTKGKPEHKHPVEQRANTTTCFKFLYCWLEH